MPRSRLPFHVVHYGEHDPRGRVGGVATFARNLELVFESVEHMTPGRRDFARVRDERLPLICDNQLVTDVPARIPVIGYQHGVGAVKAVATGRRYHQRLAARQARAAERPNTLWVAAARWISRDHGERHGNRAAHVVGYPVDLERFDGRREGDGSTLILHDGRAEHKGQLLWPQLRKAYPGWRFERLDCAPDAVPDRMRRARAFVHLSRYDGVSYVALEAMAMDLPCLLTRVGLMLDEDRSRDVHLVEPNDVFGSVDLLVREMGEFLDSLEYRSYAPRRWVLEHASPERARKGWRTVMDDYEKLWASAEADQ